LNKFKVTNWMPPANLEPYPTMKGIEFQIDDVAKRNSKAKGAKPEFVNLALLKELDQSGFIDKLYKK
jgi:hypothetical protein